jgi:hypothetical protein
MTSPDGINWNVRSAPAVQEWRSVTYGNGMFVAINESNVAGVHRVMVSPNGINWITRDAVATNNMWRHVCFGDDKFVAVAFSGTNRLMISQI